MIFYNAKDLIRFIPSGVESLGFTSGCFDIVHPLHLEYLNKCKKDCASLYVFIDSDRLVLQNKGQKPTMSEFDRAFIVSQLKPVTGVFVFNSLGEMANIISDIAEKAPDRYIAVYKNSTSIYNTKIIEYGEGIQNIIVPDTVRFESSTQIKNSIKQIT